MCSAGFGLARAGGRQSRRVPAGLRVAAQRRRHIPSFTDPLGRKLLDRAPENCGMKCPKVAGSNHRKLLDEWQLATQLWNEVRFQVDNRSPGKGQFILTGSSTPDDDPRRHSGPGRFVRLRMRPLSVFELERSSGQFLLRLSCLVRKLRAWARLCRFRSLRA
ncbi:AAA family ATPase [Buchananella felis]|uniref:AAA family ATPase n=1 Tax=Buchananella felis TaxID=3231492 RepID=UPI003527E42C